MSKRINTRVICKVRGLTLLLRVGTLWRCGDGLFFEVPPLASDALLTMLHPLLENGVMIILKEPFLGWRATLVESQRCAIEKWQWIRSPRSVEPHYNTRHTVQISSHAISGLFQP
jgi:hypothetical protein